MTTQEVISRNGQQERGFDIFHRLLGIYGVAAIHIPRQDYKDLMAYLYSQRQIPWINDHVSKSGITINGARIEIIGILGRKENNKCSLT